jgi:FkbM family methyltransferase
VPSPVRGALGRIESAPRLTAKQAIRGLVRTLLWPVRRFFDPRFAGVAERVDEVALLIRTDMDAADTATAAIGRSLAELSAAVRTAPTGVHLTRDRAELEAVSRFASRAVPVGDQTVLCRVLGKYMMYADGGDYRVAPHLCLDGYWESWITTVIARSLQPGWYCLDVGANHGYYSVIMADIAGPTGRVLAVEPVPRTAELLKKTLTVNGFDQHATVVQKAALDVDGAIAKVVIPYGFAANASVVDHGVFDGEVVEVETVTLDRLVDKWPKVDLVKIDVEGSEEAIWHGMQNTIEQNQEILIIMEVNCARYNDPRAFFDKIQSVFPLRYITPEANVRDVIVSELLDEALHGDVLLFLQRPGFET